MFDRFIEYAAKVSPDKTAIRSFEGSITFSVMNRDINRLSRALLKELGNIPKVVAVRYQQLHPHWMFVMALSRIGMASASVASDSEIAEKEVAVLKPDVIISDIILDIDTDARILVLNLDWYSQIMKEFTAEPVGTLFDPDRLVRVAIAAGTSHRRHRIDYTASMIESSINRMIAQEKISWSALSDIPRYPSLLPTLGFGSFHGFLCYLNIWSVCGSIIMTDREQYPAAIAMLRPDLMVVSPVQLQSIVQELPEETPRLDSLRLIVVAGHFPKNLREAVQERLTNNLNIMYATSEAGVVATININQIVHDDTAGWTMPWIDLQIMDDAGRELPCGDIGTIRIKSPGIVKEFYQDEKDTQQQFKNGWFYPGDLGFVNEQGLLRLVGRIDELYNFGGNKFYANQIDRILKGVKGVKDVALFSMPNENGIDQPWLAIVRGDGFEIDRVGQVIEKEFYNLPDVRVMWTNSIPRDDEGKVLRYQLSMLAAQYN